MLWHGMGTMSQGILAQHSKASMSALLLGMAWHCMFPLGMFWDWRGTARQSKAECELAQPGTA